MLLLQSEFLCYEFFAAPHEGPPQFIPLFGKKGNGGFMLRNAISDPFLPLLRRLFLTDLCLPFS